MLEVLALFVVAIVESLGHVLFCYCSHLGVWHLELWGFQGWRNFSLAKLSPAKLSPDQISALGRFVGGKILTQCVRVCMCAHESSKVLHDQLSPQGGNGNCFILVETISKCLWRCLLSLFC